MFKNLLMAALILFMAAAVKADEGQKVTSKVDKVIVFLKGAQVTRNAMVNVSVGTSDLVFGGISPGIDVQSIQVHSNGDFTILSVKHELNFLGEELKVKQVVELQARQKELRDKISLQNSLMAIYQQEEIMIGKNQVVKADNLTLDVLKLREALDFQTARLTSLKEKQQAVTNQIQALNIELQKYDMQIADINRGRSAVTSNIRVTVSSKNTLQSLFILTYVVQNAGWYPTYDIRAKNINSPVNIAYKANVSQQSGEEWKNVKLTLSTGNPIASGSKPELTPYFLNSQMYYNQPNVAVTSITGNVAGSDDNLPLPGVSVSVTGTSIATQTNDYGNFTLRVPPSAKSLTFSFVGYKRQDLPITGSIMNARLETNATELKEVVVTSGYGVKETARALAGRVAGMQVNTTPIAVNTFENQTNVEFNIDNPYSIPTDGKQYLVEINQVEVKSGFQYYVAPKINTDVFLTAQLTDWNKYNFLSGEANLYFEGTYIGKSLIDVNNAADTLNLSMGIDKNIVVTRTLEKNLTQNQTFGSNKKETKNWVIAIKNRKNQKIDLLVEDQVPISQNSNIEVETQETSGVKPDLTTGKVSWNLTLNSQDDKKLQLKYMVKYPKSQSVIVQ